MAATTADAPIPESVTIPGAELFELYVTLHRLEETNDLDSEAENEAFLGAVCDLWHLAFGRMYRPCDNGYGEESCPGPDYCLACNGSEEESATALYRLALERAAA